jgi:V/A-type H+-transporting ATPase subunit I
MLKMQLLGHSAIRDDIKRFLRESGVLEITDVTIEDNNVQLDEDVLRGLESRLELAVSTLEFLDGYAHRPSFFEKLSSGPLVVSTGDAESMEAESPVEELGSECSALQLEMRSMREALDRSRETVSMLQHWKGLDVSFEDFSTRGYLMQLWKVEEKSSADALDELRERFQYSELTEFRRIDGSIYLTAIVSKEEIPSFLDAMKELGAHHHSWGHMEGTPSEIIRFEESKWKEYKDRIEKAEARAVELAKGYDRLCILIDHYTEEAGLRSVDSNLYRTDSTFIVEGWVRAIDRKSLEKRLSSRFDEVEVSFRDPLPDEEPPIHLDNNAGTRPYEFVSTLYGRPVYREFDPTPLLAPFFVLFFAMCLTDAGYGLTLALLSGLILVRFKPSGGTGLLMRVLFMGGIATAVVGVVAGGMFGIKVENLPLWLRQFIFIDPLSEPMKMLNISFIMGLVHMIFGMGIRMVARFKAGLIVDAILDDLVWMVFLIVLAPLGYAGILGGSVPPGILNVCKWSALSIAAIVFLTGGRHQKSFIKKILTGLVKFYDIIGYFGDVLSYARLLALGLATSAIAIAVNDIAAMVKGFPFYTGYIVMVLILVGGHAFNLAVNTLGAFVHSGRLQYLEFFSKFFTGGGREFKPFKSERQYSILKKTDDGS